LLDRWHPFSPTAERLAPVVNQSWLRGAGSALLPGGGNARLDVTCEEQADAGVGLRAPP
jgi:hypothetical protein